MAEVSVQFGQLPGIPKPWNDFLHSRLSFGPADLSSIPPIADAALKQKNRREDLFRFLLSRKIAPAKLQENIERLASSDSVVVATRISASLFGGPARQILKCLTAKRICDELAKHSVNAVPVGWIDPDPSPESVQSINLVDGDGELRTLQVSSPDTIFPDEAATLVKRIDEIGDGKFDPDVIAMLGSEFVPGTTLSSGCADFVESMLREWGVAVVDSGRTEIQSLLRHEQGRAFLSGFSGLGSLVPVVSIVVSPGEISTTAQVLESFTEAGLARPGLHPQVSATLVDARSRQTLDRYGIAFPLLYQGESGIMTSIRHSMPREIPTRLEKLRTEAEELVSGLKSMADADRRFAKTADSCGRRIVYQLEAMERRFDASVKARIETANRRIRKACSFLAPAGELQEQGLAAVQMPLRYSGAVWHTVYSKLDISKFEHQLIYLD